MVLTGKGRRFPDLSLLLLTVADEAEYLLRLTLSLQAQSHAVGNGQALPQRTDGTVETGELLQIRMALKGTSYGPQRIEPFQGEIALMGQGAVKSRRRMALRQDETIPFRRMRPIGKTRKYIGKIERGHNFDSR